MQNYAVYLNNENEYIVLLANSPLDAKFRAIGIFSLMGFQVKYSSMNALLLQSEL
jgi:hypothetical protein